MRPPQPAERVRLTEDTGKILAAITFVITKACERGSRPTQYDIVKSLFIADRAHLNKWGRPITFDNYVAMKHGPVPSLAYDLLKHNQAVLRQRGIDSLPWRSERGEGGKIYFNDPKRFDFAEVLTDSETGALEAGVSTVRELGFGRVRKLTHEDAAYVEAWDDESDTQAFDMSLGLMFDEADHEKARELAEYSPYRG